MPDLEGGTPGAEGAVVAHGVNLALPLQNSKIYAGK
jgi:hypothetical protein